MYKQWFVLQSYFGCEFKIERLLRAKIKDNGMESFFGQILVPTEDVLEVKGGQKKIVKRKIFPGYILLEMVMSEETLDLVRYLPNVLRFIGGTSKEPFPLTEDEIRKVFSRMIETTKRPKPKITYNIGELVRIADGPFIDFNGTIESVNYEKSRLKVAVLIFGRFTPIELDFHQVEKS